MSAFGIISTLGDRNSSEAGENSIPSLEIESQDVIRLVLQFLKENNLSDAMQALQSESGVTLNTVDSVENFASDIRHGKWDSVLFQTASLTLPLDKLTDLYEQVIFELLEAGERDLTRSILHTATPLKALRESNPERYLKLDHFCKRPFFNATDAYEMGSSKEIRRNEIAESLVREVSVVPPSRLLALLGQAMKYQKSQGMLKEGVPFDLFKNARKSARKDAEDKPPRREAGAIKCTSSSRVQSMLFSPNGESLVTGNRDGFIENWDTDLMKLRLDLPYQAEGKLMRQQGSVLCCTLSRDGELCATGNADGQIRIWKVSTGQCTRTMPQAHPQGITSLVFFRDGSQLLSTSYDQTARIHGMKSGKALKEFRGHASFVNCALYSKDSSNTILTGSADGTVKVWDLRSTECVNTFRPGARPGAASNIEVAINTIAHVPSSADLILICTSGIHAYISTTQGQILRSFVSEDIERGSFTCATISPQGKWVYCAGEDNLLYVFDAKTGDLESKLNLKRHGADTGIILNICHHPTRNLMAVSMEASDIVTVWQP